MGGRRVLLGGVILCVASGGMANAVTVIDDFSQAGFSFATFSSDTITSVQQTAPSVLGGVRYASLSVPPGGLQIEGLDSIGFSVFPAGGVLDYASSVGADGAAGLRYVSSDERIDGLSGDSFVRIDFELVDLGVGGPMVVTVSLGDGANSTAELLQTITTPGAQSVVFPFAAFSGLGSLNLDDLQEVAFQFDPGQAADFRVTQIIADVPEPATLVLLALGAFGALRRRLR